MKTTMATLYFSSNRSSFRGFDQNLFEYTYELFLYSVVWGGNRSYDFRVDCPRDKVFPMGEKNWTENTITPNVKYDRARN